MKNIAAAVGVTSAFSETVMGKTTEIQTRWSVGSIVSELMAKATDPLTVRVSKAGILAVVSIASGLAALVNLPRLKLIRDTGTTKSRPLMFDMANSTIDEGLVQLSNSNIDPDTLVPLEVLVLDLLAPVRPSYSALGALNRIETYLDSLDVADESIVVLDQTSESIYVFDAADNSFDEVQLLFTAGTKVAEFTFVADVPEVDPTAVGWE